MEGRVLIIRKALYGLKSSGAAWREKFAMSLHDMGFTSTRSVPDVWIRRATHRGGYDYYEMIFVYVDDILVISDNPVEIMTAISKMYLLRPVGTPLSGGTLNSNETTVDWGPPDCYLGANIRPYIMDGESLWSMTAKSYVKSAVSNLEERLL